MVLLLLLVIKCRLHSVKAISRLVKFNIGTISETTLNPHQQGTTDAYFRRPGLILRQHRRQV